MNKLFFFAALLALSSCTIAPNRMFKTPENYEFAVDSTPKTKGPYIIQADDKIELHIFSNDGFKLIDITNSTISQSSDYSQGLDYLVEENGETKLPVIGPTNLKGLSIKEAEAMLQLKYSKYYKDPFVVIKVVSRRAYVFISDGGKGITIPLLNDHTTLFEALALAGGTSNYSKAYHIRIIRGDLKNPQVFKADLSSVEGLKNSELEVYPNDIIYVDAEGNLSRRISTDILPYLSLMTSLLVLIAYFNQ
jgi:polysaccharide export outer membrane protein